ncbi:hypothetical protein BJX99DRAFT_222640 [Aspergillus californicus]
MTKTNHDYYGILEISKTADPDSIRSSYRRLARIKHPDKNRCATATSEFQLLQEAYSTLIDPIRRKVYDASYVPSTPASKPSTSDPASTRANSKTAENPRDDLEKQKTAIFEKTSQQLKTQLRGQEDVLHKLRTCLLKLRREVSELQKEIDETVRIQASKASWWGYISSHLPGQQPETEEQKMERDRHRLQKTAARRVKEDMIQQQENSIRVYERAVIVTQRDISLVDAELSREAARREQERMKMQQENLRQEREKSRGDWRKRRTQEEKETTEPKPQNKAPPPSTKHKQNSYTKENCQHQGWWIRVDISATCSRCSTVTRHFAFQCPGCEKLACASCRGTVKRKAPEFSKRFA